MLRSRGMDPIFCTDCAKGLRAYQTRAKERSTNLGRFLTNDRTIIPALDVSSLIDLGRIMRGTARLNEVEAYKVGFTLGLKYGLDKIVAEVRERSDALVIYDHQKAGTDIPDTGTGFARVLAAAGVDAAILFPLTGPATQEAWIKACQDAGLEVIVGGHMTHPKFTVSEGGYIADDAPPAIYKLAAKLEVRNFVVPGNKLDFTAKYCRVIADEIGSTDFDIMAPGFGKQGGDTSQFACLPGEVRRHQIVGRKIIEAEDDEVPAVVRALARELCAV